MHNIDRIRLYKCKWSSRGLNYSTWQNNESFALVYEVISGDYSGWGESSSRKGFYEAAKRKAGSLLGKNPEALDSLLENPSIPNNVVYQWYNGFNRAVRVCREGFSMALHDLVGKLTNKPVYELLGRPRLRTSVSGMPVIHVNEPTTMRKIAESWYSDNFKTFKVKLRGCANEDIKAIEEILSIGGDCRVLLVDANYGYQSVKELLKAGKALSALGVTYFQNPIRLPLIAYKPLASAMNLKFSADNTAYWPNISRVLMLRAADLVNLHPNTMGSIEYFYRTVDCARRFGKPVIMGSSGLLGIQDKCFQKLAFTLDTPLPSEEIGLRPYFDPVRSQFYSCDFNPDILENSLCINQGEVIDSDEFGFGVQVNLEKLKRVVVDTHEISTSI